jgi:D-lactate dehydrogenase
MKIVAFEVEEWERPAFDRLAEEHELRIVPEPLTEKNAAEHADAEVVSTFIYSKLNRAVLDRLTDLKLIATRSTGFDHIDQDRCRERDVAIATVPTYGENTVAEHVFALLLAISHGLEQAIDRTRKGDFSSRGLEGFDLFGKTLGVVGTGHIGQHAIRIARGFGMEVLGYDVAPDEDAARELGFRYVSLEELLGASDVVSLHVPANARTRGMIGWEQFQQMKDGAVLINTARGPVVDTRSLVRALAEGKLAAGLDVLPEEPVIREEAELLRSVYERRHNLEDLLADHVLLRLRNVIVTPHSAFRTREAIQRILDTTVRNIDAFARGEPGNIVGLSAG